MRKHWIVLDTRPLNSTLRFACVEDAQADAMKLAKQNPDVDYLVVEVVSHVVAHTEATISPLEAA